MGALFPEDDLLPSLPIPGPTATRLETLREVVLKLIEEAARQRHEIRVLKTALDRTEERIDDAESDFVKLTGEVRGLQQKVDDCCAPIPSPFDDYTGSIVLGQPQPKGT